MTANITAVTNIEIRDLGIILKVDETISLLENFNSEELLKSSDLEIAINNIDVNISINGDIVNYEEFVDKLSSFTKYEHNTLNKIQHNLYNDNYFVVTKVDGKSKYITYYTDETMIDKIQEDEIIRETDGRVGQIISRKYIDNNVVQEMTQNLNRNVDGKVESITTNTL